MVHTIFLTSTPQFIQDFLCCRLAIIMCIKIIINYSITYLNIIWTRLLSSTFLDLVFFRSCVKFLFNCSYQQRAFFSFLDLVFFCSCVKFLFNCSYQQRAWLLQCGSNHLWMRLLWKQCHHTGGTRQSFHIEHMQLAIESDIISIQYKLSLGFSGE